MTVATPPPALLQDHILSPGDIGYLVQCFALRHRYFVQTRGWVADDSARPGIERDGYDEGAVHFACFDDLGVCAYLRALGPHRGWMLDCEFASLVGEGEPIERIGALELSRLVVREDVSPHLQPHPVEHLLRALYGFAREGGFDTFYFVVEAHWPRLFTRRFGLPFKVLGQPHCFPDGTQTVLAVAHLDAMEEVMQERHSEKFAWYRSS